MDDVWHKVDFDRENQKIIVEVRGIRRETIELEMTEQSKHLFIGFIKRYIEIISEF